MVFFRSLFHCSGRPQLQKQPRQRCPQSWRRNSTTPKEEKHDTRQRNSRHSKWPRSRTLSRSWPFAQSLSSVLDLLRASHWLMQKGFDEGKKNPEAALVISQEKRFFDVFYRLTTVLVTLAFFYIYVCIFSKQGFLRPHIKLHV